jgi:CheY-like chemotaxis protein
MAVTSEGQAIAILVVDDDAIDRRQMERLLKATSLPLGRVDHCGCLESCLDVLGRLSPDVVLLDLNLPYSNGMDTVTRILRSEKLASIGQLAAGVAHEMNTPIGFVAGNFDAVRKYVSCLSKMVAEYDEWTAAVEAVGHPALQEKLAQVRQVRQVMKIDFILKDVQSLFDESKEGIDRVTTIVRNLRDFSRADRAEKFEDYDINKGIEATLIVA